MWFRRQAKESAQAVAIASAGDALRAVGLSFGGERPRLLWHARLEGVALSDGLKLLRRDKRLKADTLLLGMLGRAQYRLVSTEAPDLPRDEWRDAIRWRLKDNVDFPVDEAVVDVLEVPQDSGARAAKSAIAFLAPSQTPQELALAADDCGLSWSAIEVAETALRNLSAMAEVPGKAHALMVFGEDHALLVITFSGELLMTRAIEVAASALVDSNESRGGALGRAGLEVLRTLDTYERTNSNAALSGLSVILPQGTEGMLEVFSDLVYVPVKAYDLSGLVDMSSLGDSAEQFLQMGTLEELSVLGVALRPHSAAQGRQQIDLRDPSMAVRGAMAWGAVWGLRALAAAMALLMLSSIGLSIWGGRLEARLAEVQEQLTVAKQTAVAIPQAPGLAELTSLRETETQQRYLRDALAGAAGQKSHGYADLLMALGRQTQPGLWITGLTVRDEGRDMELSGRMTDPGYLPIYLGRLQDEERFKGRRFAQLEMSVVDEDAGTSGQGVTQFVLRSTEPGRPDAITKDSP